MYFNTWRYKRFHTSYGIGWACLGALVGLGLSRIFMMSVSVAMTVMLLIIMVVFIAKLRWYSCIIVLICAVVIGIGRGTEYALSLQPLESYANSKVMIRGTITEDPKTSSRGERQLVISNIKINDKKYQGSVWVTTREEREMRRGDAVVVQGTAKQGFGVYQLSVGYATIAAQTQNDDPILALRDRFVQSVRAVVVEPAASLGVGFVVGQKSSLPTQLEDQLRVVGLTHLVVASGYNLTILIRFAKRLFEKHSKYLVAATSSFLIVGFIALSGASPSMVRAGIVAGLSMAAWYYGRHFHPLLLIVYVAAATAVINPLYLWGDIGWWLSFLAFFGVMIVSPLFLHAICKGKKQPSSIVQLVSESVSAQVMTLPLILAVFGSLPVLALLANILSAPLIPFAMLVTFVAGCVHMVFAPLGVIAGIVAEIILSYFIAIVRWLSMPSWAQIDFSLSPLLMIVTYVVVAGAVTAAWWVSRYNPRSQSIIE